ncbi:MAG: glucosamine-6-phosphate deaminase [Ignavibacteriaceae bacterium]|jgi:glucosamine-6-phosphate deaminase|nr:glucosamine-6-phosphate deaminase [Ignavibacteriaceae bacterium]
MYKITKEKLDLNIYPTREEMGKAAADYSAAIIKKVLSEKESLRAVFAAAPSQNEFLENILLGDDIEWNRIHAFHMDEYSGISPDSPQSFANWLKNKIFSKKPFASVSYIDTYQKDPDKVCSEYEKLLKEAPIDIVFMGIGENGHIAFNDPPVADFNDPKWVKTVELEEKCKVQQVFDGCFSTVADVPNDAITLTIPALLSADYLSVVVPGIRKSDAVRDSIYGEISTQCPASILRTHKNAKMFLDFDAANKINYK